MSHDSLVEVRDLCVSFATHQVIKNVCLDIRPGETVGLVGESGSGKTTIGRSILGIGPANSGRILFEGGDIANVAPRDRVGDAARIQAVFQDPYTSLNPSMTIEDILTEPMVARHIATRDEARLKVRELLDQVSLPADAAHRYPREFSGGQRQRVAIARALALSPRLIVCDEPVSALDLTTQATVMDLFIEIQERTGVAYLFVSHDLAVVRHISHRVAVMRGGEIVEFGDCDQVTARPEHPYTRRLLLAAPVADPIRQAKRRQDFLTLDARS
ncbi:Oligopeptide transport ATP-binding protein OppF [Pseudooceanicola marinus]|uniref:Oligopeptide transport ATP-binding protein OppF n=1 Tax=Pseudooceanicola marinus TaxID=396013 RepID=A0A1X6ZGB4_9RHOB|nr:ATP-binding cassette domain-containing protein [Pseudooceanicola marinus]PJE28533.1 ABC transporter ATP-binding protein [Pseudooceanicola marinus]SLN50902.1 Oligopeptide transport ATP-binding protein OppF [Pseudooceanicola marinus]